MVVNSLMTNIANGQSVTVGKPLEVKGIAWGRRLWDSARRSVAGWRAELAPATLGQDYGRFSFRQWTYQVTPAQAGPVVVMARASNRAGATQTFELIANPAGYHHNVVQRGR